MYLLWDLSAEWYLSWQSFSYNTVVATPILLQLCGAASYRKLCFGQGLLPNNMWICGPSGLIIYQIVTWILVLFFERLSYYLFGSISTNMGSLFSWNTSSQWF